MLLLRAKRLQPDHATPGILLTQPPRSFRPLKASAQTHQATPRILLAYSSKDPTNTRDTRGLLSTFLWSTPGLLIKYTRTAPGVLQEAPIPAPGILRAQPLHTSRATPPGHQHYSRLTPLHAPGMLWHTQHILLPCPQNAPGKRVTCSRSTRDILVTYSRLTKQILSRYTLAQSDRGTRLLLTHPEAPRPCHALLRAYSGFTHTPKKPLGDLPAAGPPPPGPLRPPSSRQEAHAEQGYTGSRLGAEPHFND